MIRRAIRWELQMGRAYMQYSVDQDNILTAIMDDPEGRVNVMNDAFLSALNIFTAKLESERDVYRGVILSSAKSTFFAGGDLEEIQAVNADNRDKYFNKVQTIKAEFRRLEKIGIPIVAAINGAALGGGYEICLACHHRIATDNPKSTIGLPEVTLGLLPGGGGVIRLTRKIGLKAALSFLLTGKALAPADACKQGLIEEIASDELDMMTRAKDWIMANPAPVQPWDHPDFEIPGGCTDAVLASVTAEAETKIAGGKFPSGPAPSTIIHCAVTGITQDLDTASRIETGGLTDLAISPEAKVKITEFFNRSKNKAGTKKHG